MRSAHSTRADARTRRGRSARSSAHSARCSLIAAILRPLTSPPAPPTSRFTPQLSRSRLRGERLRRWFVPRRRRETVVFDICRSLQFAPCDYVLASAGSNPAGLTLSTGFPGERLVHRPLSRGLPAPRTAPHRPAPRRPAPRRRSARGAPRAGWNAPESSRHIGQLPFHGLLPGHLPDAERARLWPAAQSMDNRQHLAEDPPAGKPQRRRSGEVRCESGADPQR